MQIAQKIGFKIVQDAIKTEKPLATAGSERPKKKTTALAVVRVATTVRVETALVIAVIPIGVEVEDVGGEYIV